MVSISACSTSIGKRSKRNTLIYEASQSRLMWNKLKRHKLAIFGSVILALLYLMAILADFIAPYETTERFKDYQFLPPMKIHLISEKEGLRTPFVYALKKGQVDRFVFKYQEDKTREYSLKFFIKTEPYKVFSLFTSSTKLFGCEEIPVFLFGSDRLSRDIFSRAIYASRISLFIGFGGVFLSFIIGSILGGISGFFGGVVDNVIQRIVELFMSIPKLPLWMALSAAVPRDWTGIQTYFAITLILSFMAWTGLARVVRGKIISLRGEDYVLAAQISGAKSLTIIRIHLLPAFTSYLVVHLTLAIPQMILGETALSFLGLGIQPPDVSWGSLLKDAQSITALVNYPWYLIVCIFVIITVLMFNFVGDGLRDAADPYTNM